MIEFTKDETFEIEKHFDMLRSRILNEHYNHMILSVRLKELGAPDSIAETQAKLIVDIEQAYAVFSKISQKCKEVRNEPD